MSRRTLAEIAEPLLEQSTLTGGGCRATLLPSSSVFPRDRGDPMNPVRNSACLASDAKLASIPVGHRHSKAASSFMAARGIEHRLTRFSSTSAAAVDYYTGFEFELRRQEGNPWATRLAAGGGSGRYDGL